MIQTLDICKNKVIIGQYDIILAFFFQKVLLLKTELNARFKEFASIPFKTQIVSDVLRRPKRTTQP